MDRWINTTPGFPIASDFNTTGGQGSPVCVDLSTTFPYILSNNVITPIASAFCDVPSRAALAAFPSTAHAIYLTELYRQGWFRYDPTNIAASCSAGFAYGDLAQGFFILPAADPTGASGCWVRIFNGWLDLGWFGALGDCTAFGVGTDNSPAFNSAKAVGKVFGHGAALLLPKAPAGYRCASPINFTEHVHLIGQGFGQNPGIVNGVTYPIPNYYRGSLLVFDTDVAGLQFTAYTDHLPTATAFQYESSTFSVLRDLMLISAGGVGTVNHGIDVHAALRADNVRVNGFAGNGLNINCNTAGSAGQYGNADESSFSSVTSDFNKLHGLLLDGNDANNINFASCKFTNNGGCGSLDFTVVGCNSFIAPQYATNNQSHPSNSASGFSAAQIALVQAQAPCLTDRFTGSAIQYRGKDYSGNDIGNVSAYFDGYVEGGEGALARLRGNTKVIGGFLSQSSVRHSEYTADTWGVNNELIGVLDFYAVGSAFTFHDLPLIVSCSSGSNIPYVKIVPSGATYSELIMQGNLGSSALGLGILAGAGNAYFSADTQTVRNAAQTTVYGTWSSAGLNLGSGMVLKANGTQVVTTRQTGTAANATDLATAITLVNDLKAKLITHGLIS